MKAIYLKLKSIFSKPLLPKNKILKASIFVPPPHPSKSLSKRFITHLLPPPPPDNTPSPIIIKYCNTKVWSLKQSLLRDMDKFETASLPLGHSGNIACTLSEKSVDSFNANHHFSVIVLRSISRHFAEEDRLSRFLIFLSYPRGHHRHKCRQYGIFFKNSSTVVY